MCGGSYEVLDSFCFAALRLHYDTPVWKNYNDQLDEDHPNFVSYQLLILCAYLSKDYSVKLLSC